MATGGVAFNFDIGDDFANKPLANQGESLKESRPPNKPNGKPLSGALDTSKASIALQRVSKTVDSVHGDGEISDITVKMSRGRVELGEFSPGDNQIKVSANGDHPELTFVHEIGHLLDDKGIGTQGNYASKFAALFDKWRDAVDRSKSTQILQKLSKFKVIKMEVDGKPCRLSIHQNTVEYLLRREEQFARSYAQYIALKSGNPVLLKQLEKLREEEKSVIYYPRQWDDDEFEPIADAIDEIFRNLGWIK